MAQYAGEVKWSNNATGYGFLGREGGPDVFVHYSSIEIDGYKSLREADPVEFDTIQRLQRGSLEIGDVREDYGFSELASFDAPGHPKLHFVERRYSHDAPNWWLPNKACTEAMLSSSGFTIESQPVDEVHVCHCKPVAVPADCCHAAGGRT